MTVANGSFYMADDQQALRTAIVGEITTGYVNLIVTLDSTNFETFRGAIQQYFGITETSQYNYYYQGVMLDGGSSTSFRAKNYNTGGSYELGNTGVALPQIIALKYV